MANCLENVPRHMKIVSVSECVSILFLLLCMCCMYVTVTYCGAMRIQVVDVVTGTLNVVVLLQHLPFVLIPLNH